MRKWILTTTMTLLTFSGVCQSREMSASGLYAASSAVVSVGSSALVSGIILSPVTLPVALIMKSVEKNKTQKTALLTATDPGNKEVKMVVPLAIVEQGNLQAGDKLTLEKTPEGTGAYLKKDGKVLAHMVDQEDSTLSNSQPVPTK